MTAVVAKKHQTLVQRISGLNACLSAKEWLRKQKSAKSAWENCPDGSWMVFYLERVTNIYSEEYLDLIHAIAREAVKTHPNKDERQELLRILKQHRKSPKSVTINSVRSYGAASAAVISLIINYDGHLGKGWAIADLAEDAMYNKLNGSLKIARKKIVDLVRKHYPSPPLPKRKRGAA